jgi:hypothetical protein
MIPGVVADLLQHALQKLQPGIWYVVDDINGYHPSFRKSINISHFLYDNLHQLSGILTKHGENYRFNLRNLDNLRIAMQENIIINSSRCFLERGGRDLLFLCINAPLFHSPREQAKSRQRLVVENNQLDEAYLVALNCLSHRQAPELEPMVIDEVPVLVAEAAEVDEEAQGLVEAAGEEDEEGQQQLPPYQCTIYYHQQCILFEEQINEWVRNYKEEQLLHFEHEQLQQYEAALLVAEHEQQHSPANNAVDGRRNDVNINNNNNIPNDDNNNIIINAHDDCDVNNNIFFTPGRCWWCE